jgi:hypothetical protein
VGARAGLLRSFSFLPRGAVNTAHLSPLLSPAAFYVVFLFLRKAASSAGDMLIFLENPSAKKALKNKPSLLKPG